MMKRIAVVGCVIFPLAALCQLKLMDVDDSTDVGPTNDPFHVKQTVSMQTTLGALSNTQGVHKVTLATLGAQAESNRVAAAAADAKAQVALDRPTGTDTGTVVNIVAPIIAPVAVLASNALARPVGVSSGYVASAVSDHNESPASHSDIRASVSNAVDLATGAVKTNGFGGLAVGEWAVSVGAYSFAYGELAMASGVGAWALGNGSAAYGNGAFSLGAGYAGAHGSFAFGWSAMAEATNSFAFGAETRAIGDYSKAFGYRAIALHPNSFVFSSSTEEYFSHGDTTFNINPLGGLSGFYIGETNLQTYLDEKLPIDHENEASAHCGRITALEARPTGLTTNTPFPFVMFIDPYSTNGVVRMAVSNGIFQIWGLK